MKGQTMNEITKKSDEVMITFPVPKATAKKMEVIRKWQDPEKIWNINHYARLCFNVQFQQDLEAKKAFDEEERERRKRELELKEAQSKADKPKGK